MDAEKVEAAAFELAGVRLDIEVIRQIATLVGDALPPEPLRPYPIEPPSRKEEDAAPFRRAHPFVAVRGEAVDAVALDVDRQRADGLNRVDAEENAAPPAE